MVNVSFYKRFGMIFIFLLATVSLLYVVTSFRGVMITFPSIYIMMVLIYTVAKRISRLWNIPKKYPLGDYTASVVLVFQNEDIKLLLSEIKNILNQDYPIKELVIIDNGSRTLEKYRLVKKVKKQLELYYDSGIYGEIDLGEVQCFPEFIIKRFDKAKGFIKVRASAFRRSTGEIVIYRCLGGEYDKDEIKEVMRKFTDEDVSSVIGPVNLNFSEDNIIITLIKLMYENDRVEKYEARTGMNNILLSDNTIIAYRRQSFYDNNVVKNNNRIVGRKYAFLSEILELLLAAAFAICFFMLIYDNILVLIFMLLLYHLSSVAVLSISMGFKRFKKEICSVLHSPIYTLMKYIFYIPLKVYAYIILI